MGIVYALLAALCNSTIGIISRFSMSHLDYYQIAHGKCLLAFLMLSIFCLSKKSARKQVMVNAKEWKKISILSFFGIFVLYFFETKAFALAPVASVSFTVYAAGIITVLLGCIFLNETMNRAKAMGIVIAIFGSILMGGGFPKLEHPEGIIYALIGGGGYSLFILLARKFRLEISLGFLWWLLGIGTIYLTIPALLHDSFELSPIIFSTANFNLLLMLAFLPTIGGFYFTSKAIHNMEASKVQMIEMSDPVFASILAFVCLNESMGLQSLFGGTLLILGLIFVAR